MSRSTSPSTLQEPAERDEGDALLTTSLLNQRALNQRAPEEDPDLALAKMLQQQEQAWLAMAGGSGALENLPGLAGAGAGAGEPAAAARADATEGGAEEELTDEEVARRMQEEEEREFQARLLALTGVGPAAGAAGGEADEDGAADGGGEGAADEGEGYFTEDEVDPDEMTYEELTALGEAVGTVSRGIPQAEIDALPQALYYEVAGATAGAEEQCPICRVEFEPEDGVKVLPLCSHYYHPDCITEWLKRNKVCCICNKEVLEEGKQAGAACGGGKSVPAESGTKAGVLGERRQQ